VNIRRNVGLGVAVGVDVSVGLAVGSGDDVAVTVVAALGVGLDAAVDWNRSRSVAESDPESEWELVASLPRDADKHKAYNQACGRC
jgi:hypothetical protein